MFDLYIKFLMDTIVHQSSWVSDIDLVSHVLKVYEKAQSMGCITEDLACQNVSFLLELGRLDDARNLAEKLCNGELSKAASLWDLRLSIEMKRINTPTKDDLSSVFNLLQNPLRKIAVSQAESLWLMVYYFFNHLYFVSSYS